MQENALENIVCEMSAILPRPQYVKTTLLSGWIYGVSRVLLSTSLHRMDILYVIRGHSIIQWMRYTQSTAFLPWSIQCVAPFVYIILTAVLPAIWCCCHALDVYSNNASHVSQSETSQINNEIMACLCNCISINGWMALQIHAKHSNVEVKGMDDTLHPLQSHGCDY